MNSYFLKNIFHVLSMSFLNKIIIIKIKYLYLKEGKYFSKLIEECYGMEYFMTDEKNSFLISVNWYIIEILWL